MNSELRNTRSAAAEAHSANSFTIMAAVTAAMGGFLFGYDTGVISGALLFLSSSFALSTEMQGVVTSAVLAGACLAAGFGGWLADRFGRRLVMLDVAFLFVIGALLSAFAGSVDALLGGRFLIGMCIGAVSFVAPLYIAEIAPPRHRGKLVSLNQLAITMGILISYIVDTAYAATESWRWMLGLGAVPGILLAIGMAYLPESPRWLLKGGRETEAAHVLKRVHGSADVIAEIADIKTDLQLERDTVGWRQLLGPTFRRPMLLGVGLAILQQITGINTVIYYAPTIFQSAGYRSATAAILATAGVGVINVAFTILALRIIDGAGRRALLLVGTSGMAVSLLVLAGGFAFGSALPGFQWLAVGSLMAYVAFFAIGLGPVFWLLISEIFPLTIRGRAMGVATITNWGFNFLVALTFLQLLRSCGPAATFTLYALLSIVGWFFAYRLVPETKALSLETIERFWMEGRPIREWH